MENQELLDAVLRAPDDDRPRLRYADWCKQQKDSATQSRAEFIALQLRLAGREQQLDQRERYALGFQSGQLKKRYGKEWAAPIADMVERYGFDRGFVEIVTLRAGDFRTMALDLFRNAPIRHLNLTAVQETPAKMLVRSPHLRRIRSLDLEGNDLGDDDLRALAASPSLTSLRWLSLANNRIGLDGALALAVSPLSDCLRYVAFHGNPFEPNERYSYDDGFVVDSWLPEDGVELEMRSERNLPWLRHAARTIDDSVPDRLR